MQPSATRKLCTIAIVTIAVAIGLSRVYLGVHYISDVIAGQFEGLAIAMRRTSERGHKGYQESKNSSSAPLYTGLKQNI